MSEYNYKGLTYRSATKEDILGLVLFLSQVTQDNALSDLEIVHDIPLSANVIRELINDNKGVALIAEKNDIIYGAIVLGYTHLWWSPETSYFSNLAFFVAPEYRKGLGIQGKLLELVKAFSDSSGTPVIIDIFDNSGKNERLAKYLSMKDFKNIGFKSLYRPKKE